MAEDNIGMPEARQDGILSRKLFAFNRLHGVNLSHT